MTNETRLRPLVPDVDDRFAHHYRRLQQVFLYVTDECNLRCSQCYYKPWLKRGHPEIATAELLGLLQTFYALGARKVSLLGGEPTLYGRETANLALPLVLREIRKIGYSYIRVVTNGLFDMDLFDTIDQDSLDEITFSVDGHIPAIHDSLRGNGTFDKTMMRVREAVRRQFSVHITTCVHCGNASREQSGLPVLDTAIRWAESLKVELINFHPLFKMGIARDDWTMDTDISSETWSRIYSDLKPRIDSGIYEIDVRLPQRFVSESEYSADAARLSFCPVKLAERIEVHHNGNIHSCALNNGTPTRMAYWNSDGDVLRIAWDDSGRNEWTSYPFDSEKSHPCAIMSRDFAPLVPLCISFKPDQNEFIWRENGWT